MNDFGDQNTAFIKFRPFWSDSLPKWKGKLSNLFNHENSIMSQPLEALKQPYSLTTGQNKTLETLQNLIPLLPVIVLQGSVGSGKTQVLKKLSTDLNAQFFALSEVLEQFGSQQDPLKSEDTLSAALGSALKSAKILIIDDIDIITAFARFSGQGNPRYGYISAVLKNFLDEVIAQGKHIVLSLTREVNEDTWFGGKSLQEQLNLNGGRAVFISLPDYSDVDYAELLVNTVGQERASRIDVGALRSFASNLSGNQIVTAARLSAAKIRQILRRMTLFRSCESM